MSCAENVVRLAELNTV